MMLKSLSRTQSVINNELNDFAFASQFDLELHRRASFRGTRSGTVSTFKVRYPRSTGLHVSMLLDSVLMTEINLHGVG